MQRKRYRVRIPAGVRDGSRIRVAGKGEDGAARRPARRPLRGHPGRRPPRSSASATTATSRSTVPITIAEAIQGATVEVPTLSGTKRIRIPAGTQHGTVQRLRGEGPPKPGGARPRRHPLPARGRDAAATSADEQRQALDAFAEAINDHDPRERLLRDASAAIGEGWSTR